MGGDPEEVRVEQEEENERDGHEIHVNAEDDAGVIEAPAALDAADGFCGADDGEKRGDEQEDGGLDVGEPRDEDREYYRGEDEGVAAG